MAKPTKPYDAIVQIKAFGLNRMDLLQREGHYPLPPQAGKILGVEFAGIITQEAEQAGTGFKAGDEVFGLAYGGVCVSTDAVHLWLSSFTITVDARKALMPNTSPSPPKCSSTSPKSFPGNKLLASPRSQPQPS